MTLWLKIKFSLASHWAKIDYLVDFFFSIIIFNVEKNVNLTLGQYNVIDIYRL